MESVGSNQKKGNDLIDINQLRDLVKSELSRWQPEKGQHFASPWAVNLLLGTIAQESHLGTYLRQLGGGPALGICQMEPSTFRWLRTKYGQRFPGRELWEREVSELVWDNRLAILTCRLRYVADPKPIPEDLDGIARYYKRVYNTELGAATPEQFVRNYRSLVLREDN